MLDNITTVTQKGQVTIPASIRKACGLKTGDRVAFKRNTRGDVIITKSSKADTNWHRFVASTLTDELSSKADDKAFVDL